MITQMIVTKFDKSVGARLDPAIDGSTKRLVVWAGKDQVTLLDDDAGRMIAAIRAAVGTDNASREAVEQAHMAGQMDAGCKHPSYSNARAYADNWET